MGDSSRDTTVAAKSELESCIEQTGGYRVAFEFTGDEKTIVSALRRVDADFGLISSLTYVESKYDSPLDAHLVVSKKGAPSTRSVIVGLTHRWRTLLDFQGQAPAASSLRADGALAALEKGTFAYLTPESDTGFFVPRHLLLQKNVLPESAIFAGNYDLILKSIKRDFALAGALSESFIAERWPDATPVKVGSLLGEFVVLAVSQGLPEKVLVGRPALSLKLVNSALSSLQKCALGSKLSEFSEIFHGDGLFKANERSFEFLRDLVEFQRTHPRVLTPEE
jgi:ABC-type phosphate/phosphonate transport system substrate-binding protein